MILGPLSAWLRRSASSVERGRSAQRAKFDSTKWTLELLQHLEWRRFEELCNAYFEVDGGTEGGPAASRLVHCKAWDAYRTGARQVRELIAARTASGALKGVLVTSGRFTHDAVALAGKTGIELIDGAGLLSRLEALPPEQGLALLKLATQGDFLTPSCPSCGIKMTSRSSTGEGRRYWGCPNYPRCKETITGTAGAPA